MREPGTYDSSRSPIPHHDRLDTLKSAREAGSLSRSKSPAATLHSRNPTSSFTPTAQGGRDVLPFLQARHGRSAGDLSTAAVGDKWHSLLNQLESHFRERVYTLRGRLTQILERGGTEDQAVKLLLGTAGEAERGEARVEELIREGFAINQEELLEEFQKLLF